ATTCGRSSASSRRPRGPRRCARPAARACWRPEPSPGPHPGGREPRAGPPSGGGGELLRGDRGRGAGDDRALDAPDDLPPLDASRLVVSGQQPWAGLERALDRALLLDDARRAVAGELRLEHARLEERVAELVVDVVDDVAADD